MPRSGSGPGSAAVDALLGQQLLLQPDARMGRAVAEHLLTRRRLRHGLRQPLDRVGGSLALVELGGGTDSEPRDAANRLRVPLIHPPAGSVMNLCCRTVGTSNRLERSTIGLTAECSSSSTPTVQLLPGTAGAQRHPGDGVWPDGLRLDDRGTTLGLTRNRSGLVLEVISPGEPSLPYFVYSACPLASVWRHSVCQPLQRNPG